LSSLADAARKPPRGIGQLRAIRVAVRGHGCQRQSAWWPPDQSEMDELSCLAGVALRAGGDVSVVIRDLRVEAQNYLVGELL
jgi:hypothetical protein